MKDYKEAFEREVSETSDFLFESVQSSKTNAKISHYTRALAVNAIFVNGTIRFTRWDFLNDMSEFTYVYSLVKEVRFDSIFAFMYSPREGTVASKMEGQIEDKVKHERVNKLLNLEKIIQKEDNKS